MRYQILRTAKANDQLRDIVLYRAELTGSVDAALEFLTRLEGAIAWQTFLKAALCPATLHFVREAIAC